MLKDILSKYQSLWIVYNIPHSGFIRLHARTNRFTTLFIFDSKNMKKPLGKGKSSAASENQTVHDISVSGFTRSDPIYAHVLATRAEINAMTPKDCIFVSCSAYDENESYGEIKPVTSYKQLSYSGWG
jgi:hypothetical protein